MDDVTKHVKDPFIEALVHKGVPSGADVECTLYPGGDDEPIGARIDFWAPEVSDEFEATCVQVLESLGAPKGSQLIAPNLERFPELFGDGGKVLSHREGRGPSYQTMADAIAPFVADYPLLQGCRIVQIA